jgi:hypothetical protein
MTVWRLSWTPAMGGRVGHSALYDPLPHTAFAVLRLVNRTQQRDLQSICIARPSRRRSLSPTIETKPMVRLIQGRTFF